MLEAIREKKNILQQMCEHSLAALISAPLMQSQIIDLNNRVFAKLPPEESPALQALQFVLSAPNVCAAFVGMKQLEHLTEDCKVLHLPNWKAADWITAAQTLGVKY